MSDKEIAEPSGQAAEYQPRVKTGYLRRYAERVSSASTGAV